MSINKIVNQLIEISEPKSFRGKLTNRKMLNMGVKYYDSEIPYVEHIPIELKQYFDISDEYDNVFVNVYEHNGAIGSHIDKTYGMDLKSKIISISIGIDNNNQVITEEKKLGWMKMGRYKIDIINNKKIEFWYDCEHSAKTLLQKKDNLKYRVNFTFRASKKKPNVIFTGEKSILVPIKNTSPQQYKKIPYVEKTSTVFNEVFTNVDMLQIIFGFQKKILRKERCFYDNLRQNVSNIRLINEAQFLNVGNMIKFDYNDEPKKSEYMYKVIKSNNLGCEIKKILPIIKRFPSNYNYDNYYMYWTNDCELNNNSYFIPNEKRVFYCGEKHMNHSITSPIVPAKLQVSTFTLCNGGNTR
jgi:hypothetical protein